MTNKKNKFFTFCFSLIPGAGEMYLGFYKMGISLMCIFGIMLAVTGVFNLAALSFILPVIWFYSFFHVHNLNSLPDEEFYALDDHWIVPFDMDTFVFHDWVRKYRKFIAGIMILFGVSILWNILNDFTREMMWMFHIPDSVREAFYRTSNTIPQGVIAFLIIILGVKMIKHKKEDLDAVHDDVIPSPPYIEVKPEKKPEETNSNETKQDTL